MSEPNDAPDWLDQAERDAKATIERLYTEGRTALTDNPPAQAPGKPPEPNWPAHHRADGTQAP